MTVGFRDWKTNCWQSRIILLLWCKVIRDTDLAALALRVDRIERRLEIADS